MFHPNELSITSRCSPAAVGSFWKLKFARIELSKESWELTKGQKPKEKEFCLGGKAAHQLSAKREDVRSGRIMWWQKVRSGLFSARKKLGYKAKTAASFQGAAFPQDGLGGTAPKWILIPWVTLQTDPKPTPRS